MITSARQAMEVLERACNHSDWHIFPCYGIAQNGGCNCPDGSECTKPGKHPASARGFKDAVSHQDAVKHIMLYGPRRNVAVACEMSDILVVDIDPRNGGHESFEALKQLTQLPPLNTVEALTGNYLVEGVYIRGQHLYFKVPANMTFVTGLKAFPGIDFKHKGYVVAPPSMHSTGVSYEWVQGRSPDEISIQPLPDTLVELLKSEEHPQRSLENSITKEQFEKLNNQQFGDTAQTALRNLISEIRGTARGNRNNQAFKAAVKVASWAAAGTVPLSEALNAVTAACIETGLSEQEVVQTVIRAVPYGLANPQQAYAYEPWMDEVARGLSGAGGGSA